MAKAERAISMDIETEGCGHMHQAVFGMRGDCVLQPDAWGTAVMGADGAVRWSRIPADSSGSSKRNAEKLARSRSKDCTAIKRGVLQWGPYAACHKTIVWLLERDSIKDEWKPSGGG
jgi:hypothetical protein